jgi:dTDP-4-dehydrorhamnose reductase
MKIYVAGANGMLGRDLCETLESQGYAPQKSDIGDFDLCDLDAVTAMLTRAKPDVVINCAGYTNVDGCETDILGAYRGNAVIPANLAVAANKLGAALVHISTDYVFDGEASVPYTEDAPTNPQSVYGKSKRLGELNVVGLTNRHFILRIQGLYGRHGKNFVKTMLSLAKTNPALKVVDDQFGGSTYTKDLAEAVAALIKTEAYGTYHVSNMCDLPDGSYCSWHRFAEDIMELAGIHIPVTPCSSAEFPRPAKRPRFSVLDNTYFRARGFKPLRHYKEALRDYLKEELT